MSNDDGDWKPNGRPQSTMARNFSASLNDAFAIHESSLDGLVQSVEQKKQAVNSQNQELEALEARLRETEQRLKERQSRNSSPAGKSGGSPHRRKPLGGTFSGQENDRAQQPATSPLATQAPMSQPVMPSTISQWRPDTRESSSGTAGITGDMPVGQPAVQQESRFAE